MGANTGNQGQISAARQRQAMEGQAMRRRGIQQQTQAAPVQQQTQATRYGPKSLISTMEEQASPVQEQLQATRYGPKSLISTMEEQASPVQEQLQATRYGPKSLISTMEEQSPLVQEQLQATRYGPKSLISDIPPPIVMDGIDFGPGRANRTPRRGSPEYEQLLQRVRGLGQMRR